MRENAFDLPPVPRHVESQEVDTLSGIQRPTEEMRVNH